MAFRPQKSNLVCQEDDMNDQENHGSRSHKHNRAAPAPAHSTKPTAFGNFKQNVENVHYQQRTIRKTYFDLDSQKNVDDDDQSSLAGPSCSGSAIERRHNHERPVSHRGPKVALQVSQVLDAHISADPSEPQNYRSQCQHASSATVLLQVTTDVSAASIVPPSNAVSPHFPLLVKCGHPTDVWQAMRAKEPTYHRDPNALSKHPELNAQMRTTLLQWMSQVSQYFQLHRETFHLSVVYIDLFLSVESNIPKAKLQLFGTTALFIAAKVEEVAPPMLIRFIEMTDWSCVMEDVLDAEMVMMQALQWRLCPVTALHWLTVFMAAVDKEQGLVSYTDLAEVQPLMPRFINIVFVLDVCVLDAGCVQFSNSVLAASLIYLLYNRDSALQCTGFHYHQLAGCVEWMRPILDVCKQCGPVPFHPIPNVPVDDWRNIQLQIGKVQHIQSAVDQARAQAQQLVYRAEPETCCTPNLDVAAIRKITPANLILPADVFPTPPPSNVKPAASGAHM